MRERESEEQINTTLFLLSVSFEFYAERNKLLGNAVNLMMLKIRALEFIDISSAEDFQEVL